MLMSYLRRIDDFEWICRVVELFIVDVRTLYNKTVLFYFYFSFFAVVRAALRSVAWMSLKNFSDTQRSVEL